MKKNNQYLVIIIVFLIFTDILNAQWVNLYHNSNIQIEKIASKDTSLYLGTSNGVYKSTDNGINWFQSGLSGKSVIQLAAIGNNLFAGLGGYFQSGPPLFYCSTDDGTSWTTRSNGVYGNVVSALLIVDSTLYVGHLSNSPHGTSGFGIKKSTDNGNTWFNPNDNLDAKSVYALTNIDTNIFAGADGEVYLSTNKGDNWVAVNNGLTNVRILEFTVTGSNLFAATRGAGIFRSSDNGANWEEVNNGLTELNIQRLEKYGNNIFAGSLWDGHIFVSTNNGSSWQVINDGITPSSIYDLFVLGENLFCVTQYDVWCRPLSEIVSVEDVTNESPTNYTLNQNYPNPFNPSTTISFSLPSKEFVTLKIYDALGKEITTLVNEEIQPGTYQKEWSAGDLSSGVYFYRLQAGKYSETKKLLLLK